MAEPRPPRPGRVALALGGVALLWTPVLALHLTPALFAALVTYGATRALAASLVRRWPRLRHPHGWALGLLVGGAVLPAAWLVEHAVQAAADGSGYTALIQQMARTLEQLRTALPAALAPHLPASLEALRELAAAWLREHAAQVQTWGGHALRGLGYALAGVVIGALMALQRGPEAADHGTGTPPLAAALRGGFDGLIASFSAVVFAQVRIAALNAALTAVYLMGVLPLLGAPLPLAGTLVAATFVTSLVPVVGNLVSNAMIVVVSLSQSVAIAGLSLLWLVTIHKLEYVVNAHLVGRRIHARAWELLVAMLVLEALFGLAGLVSAPVVYAQAKAALARRGWL